jgi:hypothetical protein
MRKIGVQAKVPLYGCIFSKNNKIKKLLEDATVAFSIPKRLRSSKMIW